MTSPRSVVPLALEALWQSCGVAVVEIDAEGSIVQMNDALRDAAVGSPPTHVADLVMPQHQALLADAIRCQAPARPLSVGLCPDGSFTPIDALLRCVRVEERLFLIFDPPLGSARMALRDLASANADVDRLHRSALVAKTRLEGALAEVRKAKLRIRKLEGILPICMACGDVRTDDDLEWIKLDTYLMRSDAVSLSHSICPGCEREFVEAEERT